MAVRLALQLQSPFAELLVKSAPDCEGKVDSVKVGFKRYPLSEATAKLEALQNSESLYLDYLREEVVFLKDIKLNLTTIDDETGVEKTTTLVVADTRTAKPIETLWGTPEECLAVLLGHLYDSAPYRVSLTTASQLALLNTSSFEQDKIKN